MQRLEVSGSVGPIYVSLGVKRLISVIIPPKCVSFVTPTVKTAPDPIYVSLGVKRLISLISPTKCVFFVTPTVKTAPDV